jgi:hypothetical protein
MISFHIRNVFDAIACFGHDEDFVPQHRDSWQPTDAIAGTPQKIEILRHRIEQGVPLFHPDDNQERLNSSSDYQATIPSIYFIKTLQHRNHMLSE